MIYGYLRVKNNKNQNENDQKIQSVINGDKLYIIDISSVCYIVDDISGEVLDYSFEKMDRYQTYEYFYDGDKYIVFITENTNNLLEEDEIFDSLIKLISK